MTTARSAAASCAMVLVALALAAGFACGDETHTIFGTVTDQDGVPVPGVALSFHEALPSQTTDDDGNYRVSGAEPGESYTVVPAKSGMSFSPESRTVTVGSGDEQVDFVARQIDEATKGRLDPHVKYPSDVGIVWHREQSYKITWRGFHGTHVRIELRRNWFFQRLISASTPNDGQFCWAVPSGLTYRDDYRVRVSSTSDASEIDLSNNVFSVRPRAKLLFPSDPGLEFPRGVPVTITWQNFNGTHVKIENFYSGVYDGTVTASTPNDGSYTVMVPADAQIRDDYRLRVTSLMTPADSDWSNNDFAVVANPRVLNPSMWGMPWKRGSINTITWADFAGAKVRIRLYKGRSLSRTISASTPNDGSFVWKVPASQAPGTDYKICIDSTTAADRDWSNNAFKIAVAPLVTYPNAPGIAVDHGSLMWIHWQDFPPGNVRISLMRWGYLHDEIATSTANDGVFAWKVLAYEDLTGNGFKVRVTSVPHLTVHDHSDSNFTVTSVPIVLSPNDKGVTYSRGSKMFIWYSGFTGQYVKIELLRGGALETVIDASASNTGKASWTPPATTPIASDYRIRITSVSAPTEKDVSDHNFSID